MPVSTYFQNVDFQPEQNLMNDLVEESIKKHGIDISYLPRTSVAVDNLYSEDVASKFTEAHIIEMYIDSTDGFSGEGDMVGQFGLEIRDQVILDVAQRRWKDEEIVGRLDRPYEGDLIYFPLNDKLFEVRFVEHEKVFYQMGNLPIFTLTCETFEYSHEDIDTGISAIDDIEVDYGYSMDLVFTSGTGNYTVGETCSNGTETSMRCVSWNATTKTLRVGNIVGTITTVYDVVGATSSASWSMTAVPDDLVILTDPLANNLGIQTESDSIFDFTDRDPFSEGNI